MTGSEHELSPETLQTAVETMRRWVEEGRKVVLDLDTMTAHTLIGLLQLVTRHPSAPLLHVAERVGRDLQAQLCADDAQMMALMETGWNPAADMTDAEFTAAVQGDEPEVYEEADLQRYPSESCGDCLCCPMGCGGGDCPTNSLGDSVCPCTCD